MTAELELEQRAHRLQGDSITRVLYQRARSLGDIAAGSELHAIEHRIVLDLASGTRTEIGYGKQLVTRHGFGITLRDIRVIDPAYGTIEDVSATPRWAAVLGSEIITARIIWGDVRDSLRPGFSILVAIHADHLTRRDFPSALQLELGRARVLIAAARLCANGTIESYSNELVVTFA